MQDDLNHFLGNAPVMRWDRGNLFNHWLGGTPVIGFRQSGVPEGPTSAYRVLSLRPDAATPPRWSNRYSTTITESLNGTEERQARFPRALYALSFQVTCINAAETAYLRAILEDSDAAPVACPLWPLACKLTAAAGILATTLALDDTADCLFEVFQQFALLWEDFDHWQVVELATVTANGATLIAGTFSAYPANALLIPLAYGHAPRGNIDQLTDLHGQWRCDFSETFHRLHDQSVAEASVPFVPSVSFRELEVFDVRPHYAGVAAGQMDELAIEAGGYGLHTPWRPSSAIRRMLKLPLLLHGLEAVGELRRFWDRHRARQIPFWVPAWVNDLELVEDAAASATEITVAGHGFEHKYALGAQFKFIALLTRAGKLECYGVLAVVEDGDNDVLTLSRGLDTALVATDTLCCPLLLARPTVDALEYDYLSGNVVRGEMSFVECPREYPGPAESSSAADSAHLGTRPVFLYRLTGGENVLTLADYGVDLAAAALTWQAADISGEDLTSTLDMLGDTLTVVLKTDDPAHPLLDYLDRLQARNYTLELFLADLDDLGALDLDAPEHIGRLEKISFDQNRITLEVSSLFRFAEMRIPKIQLQRLANRSVYEVVDPADFTTTGTISELGEDPPYVDAAAFGDKASLEGDPNWFALGKVTAGSEVRLCTGQSGARLYLNYPFRRALVLDAISAVAGDDKRAATWDNKFNALDDFLGFPYIPARNPQFKALETPKQSGGKK